MIADRYPSSVAGTIDSACFDDEAIARAGSPVKRALMRLERRLYDSVQPPRLVLKLTAPLDVVVERDANRVKPGGPDAETIRRRFALEANAEFPGARIASIPTSGGIDDTIREAMRAVWRAI